MSTQTETWIPSAADGTAAEQSASVRTLRFGNALPTVPLGQTVPRLHCRHYVRNYFDLFRDAFDRLYSAGNITAPVYVLPGVSVGAALRVTEAAAAGALADNSRGESALLALLRTLAEDGGTTPVQAQLLVEGVRLILSDISLATFAAKAERVEAMLGVLVQNGAITQAQADEASRVFRGLGRVIADVLAFTFPALDGYRVDLSTSPERYILITGHYTAQVPADPSRFLSISFANDRIELAVHLDSFQLAGATSFQFFKVKNNGKVKEKHEMLMASIGSLEFRAIELSLKLDDSLGEPTAYSWAPGHDVRRADWARPSASLSVGEVRLDLLTNAVTILLAFYEWHWTVSGLEREWEQLIRDSINGRSSLGAIGSILHEYVTPIAQRLIPVSHGLSRARYGEPFEAPGLVSHQSFDRMETRYSPRGVVICNEPPPAREIEIYQPTDIPGDLPGLDPDVGPRDWAWPTTAAGTRPRLDLESQRDRQIAVQHVSAVTDLAPRTRAIAALSIEGFSVQAIAWLAPDEFDIRAGTVKGRPVGPGTLELMRHVVEDAGTEPGRERFFAYGGYSAHPALVTADLLGARQRVASWGPTPSQSELETRPLIQGLDPGIWRRAFVDETPLERSRGSASDPCWVGLSTNCVVASNLYRKMRAAGLFTGEGTTVDVTGTELRYRVRGCTDAVADFTGDAPGGAPALALRDLVIAVGPAANQTLATYRVSLRIRTRPVIHGRGCLPDSAVTEVSNALGCLGSLFGTSLPEATRLRQVAYRDFVFLTPDVREPQTDIHVFELVIERSGATPGNAATVEARIRGALAHWLPSLPEVPILYNCFRPVGGEIREYAAEGGWLSVYRRYRFPNLDNL